MSLWSIVQSYDGFVKVILPVKALGLFSKLCWGLSSHLTPSYFHNLMIHSNLQMLMACLSCWFLFLQCFEQYQQLPAPLLSWHPLLESVQSWLPGSDLLKNCETLLSLNITKYILSRKISWKKASTETKSLQNCSVCYKVNISTKYIKHNRFATQINSSVCLNIKE